jgi:LmbE family N-acetylglucosaminyl deacetylase
MKLLLFLLSAAILWAATETPPQGAALLKTDIMFIGAHPDDETGIAATLARYAGQGKVVAAVYCTRGEGGGNMVGTQAGPSLGILRETELRDCLRILGVRHVYFLDEEDFFYTESLAATLEKWDKEDILGKLVRIVRSLRPDVVITMNPAPNPGQHGHHQAAGILATEVFSAAADPARFPDQLTHEGLGIWQVRKLYYSSSAEPNVKIRTDEPLPNGKIPADLAGQALAQHRSQAFGNFANSPWLRRPQSFVLARTAIEPTFPESDLLDSLSKPVQADAQRVLAQRAGPKPAMEFVPRAAISRFKEWARLHQVTHTASDFIADVPVLADRSAEVRVRHQFKEGVRFTTSFNGPAWRIVDVVDRPLNDKSVERLFRLEPPSPNLLDSEFIVAAEDGSNAKVRLHPVPLAIASRRKPANTYTISTNLVVQGKVDSPADLSATFVVEYDRQFFRVSVNVLDDRIVSNIEPNDIKGHWRSDSVEICIDPNPGSEHTMRAFKLGVFPFDTSGKVRAARDADANQGPIERTAPDVKLTSERISGGYHISAAIPWKDIGVKPGRGRVLGFNIILYDGDKQNAALGENINEARLAWSPRPGVQGRPDDWGRLVLR